MNKELTLGADPEFFLRDTRTGAVIPAIGLIGGTKEKPVPIPGLPKHYAMQEDNVMVEFNIPPVRDEYSFAEAINNALRGIDRYVEEKTEGRCERDFAASRVFANDHLADPQARVFGCSPDFDAYNNGLPFPAISPESLVEPEGAWRFSGGHVHVGYEGYLDYKLPHFVVVHFLDLFVGTTMAPLERAQGKRAELYGLPGRYRPTSYGVEYRSLSNLWILDEDARVRVARATINAMAFLKETPEEQVAQIYGQVPWMSLRKALASGNVEEASKIKRYTNNALPHHPIQRYL